VKIVAQQAAAQAGIKTRNVGRPRHGGVADHRA
jgi:hypothetical protein